MKKTAFVLITSLAAVSVSAQKSKVVSAFNYNKAFARSGDCGELGKGLEAINAATEHESTKGSAKTWYYRGNLYFNILASKDAACKALDAEALDKATDSYMKTLGLNFVDANLKKIDLSTTDGKKAFFNALREKSKMVDENYTRDIMGRKFPGIAGEYANRGIDEFTAKDYEGAKKSFQQSMSISSLTGRLDTIIIYNTALAAEYSKDYTTAKQMYEALIAMKYNVDNNGPSLYTSMSRIYKIEQDTAKALEYIQKGRVAYPNNNNLIVDELEYYLKSGKDQEALSNLDIAIENDAQNEILYFARGTVYESLKKPEEAVSDYKKAIELKPDYYDASFNLGAFYFNQGAEKINEANKLSLNETSKYDALNKASVENFNLAIPFIEKANELKPEDLDAANMLIKAYTRTEQYDKAKAIKAKYQ